jgi:hypothetical protein
MSKAWRRLSTAGGRRLGGLARCTATANTGKLRFGTPIVEQDSPAQDVYARGREKIAPRHLIEWVEKHARRFTGGHGSIFGDRTQVE